MAPTQLTITFGGICWRPDAGEDVPQIDGRQEVNLVPEEYRGPVIFKDGSGSYDWYVNFDSRMADGSFALYLNSSQRLTLLGFRPC